MDDTLKWAKFETEKAALKKKRLAPAEYQRRVAALKKRLGL
jgi:hypothetical protein